MSEALEGWCWVVSFSARAAREAVRTRTRTGQNLQSPELCDFGNTCSCPCAQSGGDGPDQVALQATFFPSQDVVLGGTLRCSVTEFLELQVDTGITLRGSLIPDVPGPPSPGASTGAFRAGRWLWPRGCECWSSRQMPCPLRSKCPSSTWTIQLVHVETKSKCVLCVCAKQKWHLK